MWHNDSLFLDQNSMSSVRKDLVGKFNQIRTNLDRPNTRSHGFQLFFIACYHLSKEEGAVVYYLY